VTHSTSSFLTSSINAGIQVMKFAYAERAELLQNLNMNSSIGDLVRFNTTFYSFAP